jgi:hypothetical protein
MEGERFRKNFTQLWILLDLLGISFDEFHVKEHLFASRYTKGL